MRRGDENNINRKNTEVIILVVTWEKQGQCGFSKTDGKLHPEQEFRRKVGDSLWFHRRVLNESVHDSCIICYTMNNSSMAHVF